MHLLIIGHSGQLAHALATEAAQGAFKATMLSRQDCDLSEGPEQIAATLNPLLSTVDAVIIAAAYTAVDAAESDYETAYAVNATAPGVIAKSAAAAGCPVVHISTDYVFRGDASQPYDPDAPTDPINAYGRSKAAGEHAVLSSNPQACVLRTSWVYDGSGKNFLTTMLRLAQTRDHIDVVDDQFGRPTYAQDLARAAIRAAQSLISGDADAGGFFHVSNTGAPITWADFAVEIFAQSGHQTIVNPISSSQYPTPAARPNYSVLNTQSFETTFLMPLPHWKDGLKRALEAQTRLV